MQVLALTWIFRETTETTFSKCGVDHEVRSFVGFLRGFGQIVGHPEAIARAYSVRWFVEVNPAQFRRPTSVQNARFWGLFLGVDEL